MLGFGVVMGSILALLILAAMLVAWRLADYWLASTIAFGGVVAAFLNFWHYFDAQHSAPIWFFVSLVLVALVLVGLVLCALWPYDQASDPPAKTPSSGIRPITRYTSRSDRNTNSARADTMPFNTLSHRSRTRRQ